ncbi:MAG: dipeptidase [Candidatus Aminicenantaceae bacterium]
MKVKLIFFVALTLFLFFLAIIIPQGKENISESEKALLPEFENCTSVLVTKVASADGSLMTTHSCDGGWEFRLRVVPGKTHKPGAMRPVYRGGGLGAEGRQAVKVGEIPEVKQTYSRFDIAYPFMNEKQLAIGETTFGGRRELYNPEGMWDIMALQRIVLERTSTAREAIKLIGELVARDGYGDFGECLTFIDTKEAWAFEIMGAGPLEIGAVWAAQRIPEGEVFVSANRSRIGAINLNDKENFMASENILSLAEEMELWDSESGKPFKFNEAYAPSDSIGCRRREWRVFSTLAPDLKLDPWAVHYPFSVSPKKKVSVQDLKSFHRDYYQGTEFDLSKDLAAGPFSTPNRFSTLTRPPTGHIGWERSISIFRCSYCIIATTRDWLPDWIGGLTWFAEDDPKTSCFVPLYCCITTVPESYQVGRRDVFNKKSAWWAFDFVSNWANLRFSQIINDIRKAYGDFENTFSILQPAVEARAKTLYEENPQACREYLTKYCNEMGQRVVDEWWALADYLIVKYNDGYINIPGRRTGAGYPKEWLDAVGYGKTKIKNK